MKTRDLSGPIAVAGMTLVTVAGAALRIGHDPASVNETGPAANHARSVLSATPRHIEWIAAPLGTRRILAFVVSPERSDRAPFVIVTADNQGASDWARAVADRVAEAGFIAIVPDALTSEGPAGGDTDSFRDAGAVKSALAHLGPKVTSQRIEAVRRFALASPASNGIGARLDLRPAEGLISATVQAGAAPPSARSRSSRARPIWPGPRIGSLAVSNCRPADPLRRASGNPSIAPCCCCALRMIAP